MVDMKAICADMRRTLIEMIHTAGSGHPGGSLSCVEIIAALYFDVMRIDPKKPDWPERDRFILSKGHAAPALYIALALQGFFDHSHLLTLRRYGSILQGHPSSMTTPGVDLSTGPLGLGLGAGVGMALAARLEGRNYHTYVLMGDGELQEGMVWEAAAAAAKYRLSGITAIVDLNGVQLDGTVKEIMPGDARKVWEAYGWRVVEADGHDADELATLLKDHSGELPTVVLAHTVKGKGVAFMEGDHAWHGKLIDDEHYHKAIALLEGKQWLP